MDIAILGTGLMGSAAANRLDACGHAVIAWNRTAGQSAEPLSNTVSTMSELPEAIAASEVLLLFLSDAASIHSVLEPISPDDLSDKLLVQMGTIAPEESRELAHWLSARGAQYLEAPVLGSIPETRSGTLLVMAGGNEEAFRQALPVLEALGASPRLIGPVGQAAALKLALNQMIAGLTATFALSLAFLEKEAVDIEQFMSILRDSAVYAPTFDKKLNKMLASDYENPNFPLKHLGKDIALFLTAAAPLELHTEALEGILSIVQRGLEAGHADLDYSSLRESVR